MKVSGDAVLRGPVDMVYAALNDPAVLVRTIPGCERLEQVGPDAYRMVVTAGVASVKGRYVGDVRLSEQQAPYSFVLTASGSGAPGTVSAEVAVRLAGADDGGTRVTYDADAVVGGMIGGVGQRLLAGVAKRTAGEFFAAVDGVLTGGVGEPAAAAEVAAGPGAAAPPGVGAGPGVAATAERAPAVFTRPAGPRRGLPGGDFAAGVLFGAAAALLGAVVGGVLAARAAKTGRAR
jgi:uncharacterized protein